MLVRRDLTKGRSSRNRNFRLAQKDFLNILDRTGELFEQSFRWLRFGFQWPLAVIVTSKNAALVERSIIKCEI
jgi:hypothetical protein